MKKLITIIILLFSLAATGQKTYGTYSYPMTIHVKDSTYKELGYFKFNPVTGSMQVRGTYKASFMFFVNEILIPMVELDAAKKQIVWQINDDGTIKDSAQFMQAFINYQAIRTKYGGRY